jgi:hypothetical protein
VGRYLCASSFSVLLRAALGGHRFGIVDRCFGLGFVDRRFGPLGDPISGSEGI